MALTTQQLATLAADIAADPVLSAKPNTADGAFDIAAAYNAVVSPAYNVWRSSVPMTEIMRNGFDWTFVDNLTIGKARIWEWMQLTGTIDPSEANVRAGVLAVFTAAGMATMRTQIFGHCYRAARRIEKLFAVGSGLVASDQGVGPSLMGYEGTITYNDVLTARGG
jgi:hypothetical protein